MAQQRLTVIIPTLNEAECIGKLLENVYKQTRRPDAVLVVDGQSDDSTARIVRAWSKRWKIVQLVASKTRGVGFQRDLGGKTASKMYETNTKNRTTQHLFYFLDADVRLPTNFLAKSSQLLEAQNLSAACPRYIPLTNSLWIKAIFGYFNFLFWFGQKHFPSGAGPCMIVTHELFSKLNGFKTELLVDDLDFVHRAGRIGRFAILDLPVFVSVRRFEKYGTWQTLWQYLKISWYFIRKTTHRSNEITYEFGKFGAKR